MKSKLPKVRTITKQSKLNHIIHKLNTFLPYIICMIMGASFPILYYEKFANRNLTLAEAGYYSTMAKIELDNGNLVIKLDNIQSR